MRLSVRCLAKLGIYPSRTLGADGKLRFHSDNPLTLLDGNTQHLQLYYFTYGNTTIGNQKVSQGVNVITPEWYC